MNNKILFMIIGNEVKYLADSNMDHREWYTSLGLDINNYDNIVRGYIIDGKIIFFILRVEPMDECETIKAWLSGRKCHFDIGKSKIFFSGKIDSIIVILASH